MFELLWISVPTARCFLQHHELLTDWQINNTIWKRYSSNYFKLEWIKKKLRLPFRDYSCFFTRKISWKFRLLGWVKYVWNFLGPLGGDLTFLGPDFVVGKIIFDFSWSAFCWIWIFSCLHLSNDFFFFFFFWENYRGDKNYARWKI